MRSLVAVLFALCFALDATAAEPVAVFQFAGNAKDSAEGAKSEPIRVGSGVKIGQGYAYFDGQPGASLDYGNGADDELRLLGRRKDQPLDAMTVWARVSSRQQAGGTTAVVARWGPKQRSFQLGVNGYQGGRDGRVTAAFTATGDWSSFVQVETKATGLVKNDGTQTVDLAVRFDRGDVTIFVNGQSQPLSVEKAGEYQTILNADTSAKTVIGGIVDPGQTSAGRSFEGLINEVRIYGEALSDEAIAALGAGRETAAERNRKILAEIPPTPSAEELPSFQNPRMTHVTVESARPNEYLSICPNLCELADGSLLCAYHRTTQVDFSGNYDTYARVSRDGGKTWSDARLIEKHMQAPGLLRLRSGDVLMNGCTVLDDRWSTTMKLFRSGDGGRTWPEQKPIWEKSEGIRLQGGVASLVQLKSGRILCPFCGTDVIAADYGAATERIKAGCYYSDDDGKTWQEGKGKVSLPKRGAMEPTVAELNDGTLVMALRSALGFVYVSRSTDAGETWSEAWSSGLEAPECPHVMTAFPDGSALLMVYCSGKFDPKHHHGGERTPLTAAVSKDAGKTWRKIGNIAGGPHEFGATSICFASTGRVLIAYDWHCIPWSRSAKPGGVRLAIVDKEWFYRDPAEDQSRALFERLNLDYPGMEKVKAAVDAGDFGAARAAYVQHYRDRTKPALFWKTLYPEGTGFDTRSTYYDFFTELPDRITWRDRDRLKQLIGKGPGYEWKHEGKVPGRYTLLELADMIVGHKVYHPWWHNLPPQDVGEDFNWSHIPPDGDQSWNAHLHHQEFLLALAQAYWLSGEEKYVRKLMELWTSWIDRVDRVVNLSHLIQPLLYTQLLPFALSWEELSAEDFCKVQAWLVKNGDILMGDRRSGNQLMGTGIALVWLGTAMPEAADAQAWRGQGFDRIAAFLGNESTYPDGSSKEPCFHYAVGPCRSALDAVRIAQVNGYPYPKQLAEALERRAAFYAYTSKPDGSWVWNGDGGPGSSFEVVKEIADAAGRADLQYIASFGRHGKCPEKTSVWFPWAGYGVMRSDWTRRANYLYFDVGPAGIMHGHEGKLAIEVVSYGRSLVEDLGIHTYSTAAHEMPMSRFFHQTCGHNTVIVDGKSQVRGRTGPRTTDKPLENPWVSTAVCDFLAGSYTKGWDGTGAYGADAGPIDTSVGHHRSVIFVKPQKPGDFEYWIVTDRVAGSGEHTYEQLFHLIPIETQTDPATKTVHTITPDESNLAFIPVSTDGLELEIARGRKEPSLQGWYIRSTGPMPAPCVIYRKIGAPPAIFQTVLWPKRAGDDRLPTVEVIDPAASGAVKVTLPDGRVDLYASPAAAGLHRVDDLQFDGRAALLRLNQQRKPVAWEVAGGESPSWRGKNLPK